MSRTKRPVRASAPAYLALSCIGLAASPAMAQSETDQPASSSNLGTYTVTDTAIDEDVIVKKADSPKYTAPLVETPKTVVVLPSEVIRDSGATTLVDALRMVPGITFGAGEGGNPQGDRPFIRGFDVQGSTYIDGIRSVGGQSREIFAIEQIEVVKGGDSSMGGRGSAGGSLNMVSKMPHLGNDARADFSYGTDDYKRATVDANYQIGDMAAIRINGMWHDADVAKRDVVSYNRWGISPSAALGLGTSTRAFINYYHMQSDDIPDPGMPFERPGNTTYVKTADQLHIGPAEVINGQKVRRSNFYGLANRDFRKTNVDEVLFRFEHDLSDTITIRNTAKYANVKQSYIISQPDDSQGNVVSGNVWRRANTRYSSVDSITDQLNLSGTFETGAIKHSFAVGVEGSWEQSKRGSYVVSTNVVAGNTAASQRCAAINIAAYNCTSLFNPDPYDPWANIPAGGSVGVPITKSAISSITEATTYSIYAFDTVSITDALMLNLGARYDWYNTRTQTISATAPVDLSLKDKFFNWQAGLVFKPAPNGSIYFSYATSATPPGSMIGEGSDGNSIGNVISGGQVVTSYLDLLAEKTKSYEVGTKWELFDDALSLNLAAFRTDTANARTSNPNTGAAEFVGDRRIQGFEVGFNGKPLEFWSIFGGYTYMDSKVRNGGAINETTGVPNINTGKPFPNTPKHSFTLWTTFDIADRFQIGGGVIYNSKQYGSFGSVTLANGEVGTVVRTIPGYWRFDATAAVDITDNVSLRVNAQNLTNKRYYDRTYTTHFVSIAPGRSVFGTVSFKY